MSHLTRPIARDLEPFAQAGILSPDVLAFTDELLTLYGGRDASHDLQLAVALAVRAPIEGSSCVDLHTVSHTTVHDAADEASPPAWPAAESWVRTVAAATALVQRADARAAAPSHPLVLDGSRLYLARLWEAERQVAEQLRAMAGNRLRVVTGGPGSGKTTGIKADLLPELQRHPDLRVAFAAPTGKAAARMREALRLARDPEGADPAALARLATIEPHTLHRLLGIRPGRLERFDAPPPEPVPYDLVIVDEASMISLPMLAHLLSRLAPEARVWLSGDPGQLTSVEVGSVLADIVGTEDDAPVALAPAITRLTSQYRFGPETGIGRLAAELRSGDADAAIAELQAGHADVTWVDRDAPGGAERHRRLQEMLATHAHTVVDAAASGAADAALRAVLALRTLCAHRQGDDSVAAWNQQLERALGERDPEAWYVGRPVLVTRNDRELGVMNGDLGVIIRTEDGARVALVGADGAPRLIPPVRLPGVETVHAMTIHKSQGSEFDHVVVVLPRAGSRLLTRELLYTAVTRARTRVTVVGTADALRAGIAQRTARASGLGERLRG